MARNDISTKEKVEFANKFFHIVKKVNESPLNLIRDTYILSEVSYGYESNDHVYYFDYPYPSEKKGKIVEIINDATRGVLPESAVIDKNTYKDLDITISNIFSEFKENNKKYGYVLYAFIPNSETTPEIAFVKTNIINTDINIFRKYFFVIFHCTCLDYDSDKIFLNEPKLLNTNFADKVEYLLYFNYKTNIESINFNYGEEVVTCAFLSNKKNNVFDIDPDMLYTKLHIDAVYGIIDISLSHIFSNAKDYCELNNALFLSDQALQQIKSKYNIFHTLKHRLGDLSEIGEGVKEFFEENSFTENAIDIVNHLCMDVQQVQKFAELAYLSYFSSIDSIDTIYNMRNSDRSNDFRFSTMQPLYFSNLVEKVFKQIVYARRKLQKEFSLQIEPVSFTILPHFELTDNEYIRLRLADYIYEAILLEIIINFAKHSFDPDNNNILSVRANSTDRGKSIVFSNKSRKVRNEKQSGGLPFVCNTLHNTNSGRVIKDEIKNGVYEIEVIFEGLTW